MKIDGRPAAKSFDVNALTTFASVTIADGFLRFTDVFFNEAFRLHRTIARDASGFLLHFAFRLTQPALNTIFRGFFHGSASSLQTFASTEHSAHRIGANVSGSDRNPTVSKLRQTGKFAHLAISARRFVRICTEATSGL
jgi:hypothetical protein